jgi:hypothetical protein
MGMVLMSKRELNRIDILARLDGGRLTPAAAADLMRITLRQTLWHWRGLRDLPRRISPSSQTACANDRLDRLLEPPAFHPN